MLWHQWKCEIHINSVPDSFPCDSPLYTILVSVRGVDKYLLFSSTKPRLFPSRKLKINFLSSNLLIRTVYFILKLLVKCDTLKEVRTLNCFQKYEIVYNTSTARIPLLAVFLMPGEGRCFNVVDSNLFTPFSVHFFMVMAWERVLKA